MEIDAMKLAKLEARLEALERLEGRVRRMEVDIVSLEARADLAETMLIAEQLRRGVTKQELHGFMQRLLNAATAAEIQDAQSADDQSPLALAAEYVAHAFLAAFAAPVRARLWASPQGAPDRDLPTGGDQRSMRTPQKR